jgi:anti-sigma B factor antagonist
MEITTQDVRQIEVITVKGRVDSVEAAGLVKALESALRRGKYKIVVDMGQVEYMSSAGFRALGDAQRNSQRNQRGEVILANVPALVHEALELVGFTEYFHIEESVSAALKSAEDLPAGDSPLPA